MGIPIVPNAIGFGIDTPAGSGPERSGAAVYKVTNLNPSGPGSFLEAWQADEPRVVIFEVGGYWVPPAGTSSLRLTNPFITIAGETAPHPGFHIRGCGVVIATHDVFLHHITIRKGPGGNENGLQIGQRNTPVYNLVVDHCSIEWGTDENVTSWYNTTSRFNILNSLIAEAQPSSDGNTGHGFLMGYNGPSAVLHNLFISNDQRSPAFNESTVSIIGDNYMVNWIGSYPGGNCSEVLPESGGPCKVAYVDNKFFGGQDTGMRGGPNYLYIGNIDADSEIYVNDGNQSFINGKRGLALVSGNQSRLVTEPPVEIAGVFAQYTPNVRPLWETAGARPADRDPIDARIINDAMAGNAKVPFGVAEWPALSETYRQLTIPQNFNEIMPSGYTRLEEWLHEWAAYVEGEDYIPETPPDEEPPDEEEEPMDTSNTVNVTVNKKVETVTLEEIESIDVIVDFHDPDIPDFNRVFYLVNGEWQEEMPL